MKHLTWLVALAACGSGATPDNYKPPIATLRGGGAGLGTNSDNPDLRVAIVWVSGVTADNFPLRVAQETEFSRTGPTAFEIAITERPPAAVLQHGPITGQLVAYHDLNHNLQLDFAQITDTAFTDQLVAFDPDLQIGYNEIDGDGQITVNGMDSSTPITLYGSTDPALSCHLLDWIPRSAFEASRHLFEHDLNVGPWRRSVVDNFVACNGDELTDTVGVSCNYPADPATTRIYDASWTTQTSAFIASTCGSVIRVCQRVLPDGVAFPPTWLCPCDPAKYHCGLGNVDI